ncbi:MAG: DNA polymerase III subunit chi [Burkholderiaceae bacterium]
MSRIDFHFNVPDRLAYACRVVRKARAAGKTVVVWTASDARLSSFDQQLWTFSSLDFIAHVRVSSPLAADTPVLLTTDAAHSPAADVLILLDDEIPPAHTTLFSRYGRVIDVVSNVDEERRAARVRFKTYRDQGLEPTAHDQAAR